MEKSSCCNTGILPSGLMARNAGLESLGITTTFSYSTPLISSVEQHFADEGRERVTVYFDRHFEWALGRWGVVTLAEKRRRPKRSES